ncbi:MAG TPA: polysaccharide deacetylase family protein, partial [Pyrinomonadaceae bacterium]|nr:polysaccharide deacetylase family protein [Pyrinomonadaceae bacterium]
MKHLGLLLVLLLFAAAGSAQTKPPMRTMVVTVDDLPYVYIGDGAYLASAQRGTTDILHALKKYRAPATGFVNEGHLAPDDER